MVKTSITSLERYQDTDIRSASGKRARGEDKTLERNLPIYKCFFFFFLASVFELNACKQTFKKSENNSHLKEDEPQIQSPKPYPSSAESQRGRINQFSEMTLMPIILEDNSYLFTQGCYSTDKKTELCGGAALKPSHTVAQKQNSK